MIIQESMTLKRKLEILSDAAKYDVACTSSGVDRKGDGKDVSIIDEFYRKKESKVWSSGTGDQVYLAIRLAMALSFGEQMETLPIVLDDIFVRFDEERQKETLRFLMELGKEQQIFLFTCHERTMKLAEEAGREENTGEFIQLRNGCISKRI